MATPIVQLQQHVLDHDIPTSTLVRYALLIATKIDDDEMIEWCRNELNGYQSKPTADYRIAYGEYMATDDWGRDVPVRVKDPRMLELITKVPIFLPVGEMEAMIDRAESGTAYKMYLPPKLEADLKKGMTPGVQRLFRVVQQLQLEQVLVAVRNKLFDWTLKLQKREVRIEGDFPILPARKGKEVSELGRTIQTTNYVEVREALKSPVQVGTSNSSQQTSYQGLNLDEVAALIAAIEGAVAGIQPQDANALKLLDEIETIKNLLKSAAPKHSWLREGLQSVRNILENAAGTVLGEVLKDAPYVAQIGRILGMP